MSTPGSDRPDAVPAVAKAASSLRARFLEIGGDVLAYGSLSAISKVSGLLLLPILTRTLSIEEYGAVEVVLIEVAVFSSVMRLSLPAALSRYFFALPELSGRAALASTLGAAVALAGLAVAAMLSLAAAPIARLGFDDPSATRLVHFGAWIAVLTSVRILLQTILRLQRRLVTLGLVLIGAELAYFVLTVTLVLGFGLALPGVLVALLTARVLELGLVLVLVRDHLTWRLSVTELRRCLHFSLPMLPGELIAAITNQAGRILLVLFIGLGGVGIYGAALRVARLVQFALVAFHNAWRPYAMILVEAPERNEVYRRILNYYAGLFAAVSLGLLSIAPELYQLLVPARYQEGLWALPWLLGGAVLWHASSITRLGILVREKTSGITWASVLSLLVYFGFGAVLVPVYGVTGAAFTGFLASYVFAHRLAWGSVRVSDIRFDSGVVLPVLAAYIAASVLIAALSGRPFGGLSLLGRLAILIGGVGLIAALTLDREARRFLRRLPERLRHAWRRPRLAAGPVTDASGCERPERTSETN